MRLPRAHEQRRALAEEVHARPATPVVAPAVVSCLVLFESDSDAVLARVADLARLYAVDEPRTDAAHALVEIPGGRLKWERHGEFTSLVVVRVLPEATLESITEFPSAFDMLPDGWLASLPGRVIAAADIAVLPSSTVSDDDLSTAMKWFMSDSVAASRVLDGVAWIFSDFVLRSDGRTRMLVVDREMGAAQTARVVHRLVEVEIYRMMGLLALPVARGLFSSLGRIEQQLASITSAMATLDTVHDAETLHREERKALDDLTRIAAEVERSVAASVFRFSAASAYFPIMRARVSELREQRVADNRTFMGFLARRVTPAAETIEAVAQRQESLANRIERASALLRTRVDMVREEQNQKILATMDRRGDLQLRLQQTVEGLSVAAITYYVVALISYGTRPIEHHVHWLNHEWAAALSIPVVAYVVWSIIRRTREGH
ncbi:MAG: DUF3422 domain-containing protein [Deltaproteobacteria bacterium]|nr:DUF3422 domain-containing protein [Deltaproteobacteria bacterium]